jgi:hypothetical protein
MPPDVWAAYGGCWYCLLFLSQKYDLKILLFFLRTAEK